MKKQEKAYDRLGAIKFKEHACQNSLHSMSSNWQAEGHSDEDAFAGRARALVRRGYKPKDAVDLVLAEISLECRNDPKRMAQAKAEGERFLLKIREGSI